MRRWSSGLRRAPPDTPASVWTVASQQLLRRLKRTDAWTGQEGEEGGRMAVVWLSSARTTKTTEERRSHMHCTVKCWNSFMMLGLCYGLWWEREAHRKQGREWNCVIWGAIWQILTGEMRKSRFGPVFEGKKKRGDGRGCEELMEENEKNRN